MVKIFRFLFFGWLIGAGGYLTAQNVFVLKLQDEINASSAHYMTHGIREAEAQNASLILVHMDTYGGRVDYADSIRSALLDTRIPTAVFIDKNAASAGALISLACDSIFMAPGASMGAATVVNGGDGNAAPDKYQSYFRSVMRATAEQQNRDPKIAEKMVDESLDLPGISPTGQVITFTSKEALQYHFADKIVNDLPEAVAAMGFSADNMVNYEGSASEKITRMLIHPTVSAILLLLIFGGIFMELKTPGVGFPGLVALVAIALFFAPHYIEGLAAYWEILLFGVGIVLIALEIFVIPGFGIAGILGIIFLIGGLSASLVKNQGLDFSDIPLKDILRSVTIVLVSMATSIILVIWLVKQFVSTRTAHPFVDDDTQDKEKGYTAFDRTILEYIGQEGLAISDLKPSGFIEIAGRKLDAESLEGYISRGDKIIVESVRSINLLVRRAK
jgi:membrane-bound serine protease (ClpP class)